MALYNKTNYYTDKELDEILAESDSESENLLANSKNELVADVLHESDKCAEDGIATLEPSYVSSFDHSDSNDSVEDIPLNFGKRQRKI